MSVLRDHTGDLTILKVEGDLAGPNAEELRAVASACLKEGRRDFLIDLAEAPGCDSAGLESLTWLQRQCDECLGLVRVCSLGDIFAKILEITRLQDRFSDRYDPV